MQRLSINKDIAELLTHPLSRPDGMMKWNCIGTRSMFRSLSYSTVSFLSLVVIANGSDFAGCAVLEICNKTIIVHPSVANGYTGAFVIKIYIGKNGDIFYTSLSNVTINKSANNFVGKVCSESGTNTVEICPGAKSCTNKFQGSLTQKFSTITKYHCSISYSTTGFILRSENSSTGKQHSTFGDISGDQVFSSHNNNEEYFDISGTICSYKSDGLGNQQVTNNWGAPDFNENTKYSSRSSPCAIISGRKL